MGTIILGFVCLSIGACVGVVMMACCSASSNADRQMEEFLKSKKENISSQ